MIAARVSISAKDLRVASILYKNSSEYVFPRYSSDRTFDEKTLAFYNGYQIETLLLNDESSFNLTLFVITKKGPFNIGRAKDSFEVKVKPSHTLHEILEKVSDMKNVSIEKLVASSIEYTDHGQTKIMVLMDHYGECINTTTKLETYDGIKTLTIKEI